MNDAQCAQDTRLLRERGCACRDVRVTRSGGVLTCGKCKTRVVPRYRTRTKEDVVRHLRKVHSYKDTWHRLRAIPVHLLRDSHRAVHAVFHLDHDHTEDET